MSGKGGKGREPDVVKHTIKDARQALERRQLPRPLWAEIKRPEQVEHWKIDSREIPVTIDKALEGMWTLEMEWLFTPVPGGGHELRESSVGLYVQGARGLGPEKVCLVRYDVDNLASIHHPPLGPHLNVVQPGPLRDKVHYPVPGVASAQWDVERILDVLLSARLAADLVKHLSSVRRPPRNRQGR